GASMPMHQALTRVRDKIRTILPRHEQGGIFAAEGYARVTGKPGVVMATSGPGALNLVTGLADAKLDSLPIVAITGQVPTKVIGTDEVQQALAAIKASKKPIIYCGGGVIASDAAAELLEFVQKTKIPVAMTLQGLGSIPSDHYLSLGMLGMHGTVYSNIAISEADLL